jgi:hypothetical protein
VKVLIEKVGPNLYHADLRDLPGIPPIGKGNSPALATIDLFYQILHPNQDGRWLRSIDFDNGIELTGVEQFSTRLEVERLKRESSETS